MTQKKEKTNAKSAQERYVEAQMLEQQYKQLQKYLETFDEQINAIRALVEALDEFSGLKKGDKILAPLTNGIFVRATLDTSSELLINVGQNTIVAKSIPDAKKMLEGQEAEVRKYRTETVKQLEDLMKQLEDINTE